MKYLFNEMFDVHNNIIRNVTTTSDDVSFTSFPAVVGNPNYDAFLTQVGLTDAQVHELEPNVWYDLPQKEETNG